MEVAIRRAKVADVQAIQRLVNYYVKRGKLLKRRRNEIRKNIHSFFVAEMQGKVVACVSLEIYSRKMAEIRSLAVLPKMIGKGIGKQLIEKCLKKARKKKILEVMVITSEESFFKKVGFNYTLPGERKALFYNP